MFHSKIPSYCTTYPKYKNISSSHMTFPPNLITSNSLIRPFSFLQIHTLYIIFYPYQYLEFYFLELHSISQIMYSVPLSYSLSKLYCLQTTGTKISRFEYPWLFRLLPEKISKNLKPTLVQYHSTP